MFTKPTNSTVPNPKPLFGVLVCTFSTFTFCLMVLSGSTTIV